MVMPFGLKNVPAIFSRIVVVAFNYFIQNFMVVYMDDWTIYGMVKNHIVNFSLMLEWCREHQIALNSKKCIFYALFGMLLGHVV